jgi:hypothetical protein
LCTPQPAPDPKLLAVQARAQVDTALAAHQAQLQQEKAQNDAIQFLVTTQGKIDLAASGARHDMKRRQPNNEEETNV